MTPRAAAGGVPKKGLRPGGRGAALAEDGFERVRPGPRHGLLRHGTVLLARPGLADAAGAPQPSSSSRSGASIAGTSAGFISAMWPQAEATTWTFAPGMWRASLWLSTGGK